MIDDRILEHHVRIFHAPCRRLSVACSCTFNFRVILPGYFYIVCAKNSVWAVTGQPHSLTRLERFHARCARYMAHCHIHRLPDGTWEYPPTSEVLDSCGLSTIETYIAKRKTTLLNHYAQSHSALYRRCITSTPIGSGAHRQMWWN
jgi:hypothetical protein